jgi:hypothetical protein
LASSVFNNEQSKQLGSQFYVRHAN